MWPGYPEPKMTAATSVLMPMMSNIPTPAEQVQVFFQAASTTGGEMAYETELNRAKVTGAVVGLAVGAVATYAILGWYLRR